jgi:NTP pyrophosphatase (non-canonical NTP hydrolase)
MGADLNQMADMVMSDSVRWFPNAHADLMVYALGCAGEAGEVADIVKKIARGSTTVQEALESLREETIDLLIYVLGLGNLLNIDWYGEYARKQIKNEERFGNG